MNERPLGIHASCRRCGGANEWTGDKRTVPFEGLGPSTGEVIVKEEIRCSQCGDSRWIQTGTETPDERR